MTETVVDQRTTVAVSGFANPISLAANAEENGHIKVYADDELLTLGEDYSLDGVGDTGDLDEIDGVEVTILEPANWSAYDSFTVEHDPPLDQGGDLGAGGSFGQAFENALDATARRLQALGTKLDRVFRLPVSETETSVVLPHPVENRGLVWRLGDDGYYLGNTVEDPDTEPLTAAVTAQLAAEAAQAAAEAAETEATAQASAAALSAAAAQAAAAEAGDLSALLEYLVPVGTTLLFNGTSAPSFTLKENGAVVSQTTYADLYAVIGTTYNTGGEGAGNFRLPESRGEFFRALDDGRGIDSGRALGTAQTESVGPHDHTASIDSGGSHTHSFSISAGSYFGANSGGPKGAWSGGDSYNGIGTFNGGTSSGGSHTHTITINNNSGTENRPRNVARLAVIKY